MNENYELMEQEVTTEPVEVCEGTMEEVETKSGSGLGVVVLGLGLAAVGGVVATVVKKLKNKKDDKPKKQKTKLKLVRVPVDNNGEELADVPEDDYVEAEIEE